MDTMILNRFLEQCVTWYSCGSCAEEEPADVDVIVPISYCATPQGLTRATRENILLAVRYARQFPHAVIAFGNAEYVFKNASHIESSRKRHILKEAAIPDELIIEADTIKNSVEEAYAVHARLTEANARPRRILLITGAMHAPSARLIWSRVFPEAGIFIRCIPYAYEIQADHPIIVQRSSMRWFAANVMRHLMLLVLGLRLTARFHHIVSTRESASGSRPSSA